MPEIVEAHLPQSCQHPQRVPIPGVAPASCVFIGDQTTDIEAGQAAGVSTIGFANKPGKVESLRGAGADAILTTMLDLAHAIR